MEISYKPQWHPSSTNPSYTPALHCSACDDLSVALSEHLRFSDGQPKSCLCSPTAHRGSFRCSLHKPFSSLLINPRKLAIQKSVERNVSANCGWVNRIMKTQVWPSSIQKPRRKEFQRRPSRLSAMSK
ncbi:uncharacterized protein LOC110026772 [Phalaenopsis equestris]|uniref:uncharacterized protein LOC110026772 n=1 Tax=Phalaenopsis equestris TaxID=78828 RepID=UPI0009E2E5D5|nr:uncharacterized protein LOC110026772 [Phalaenopsis equestris]